MKLSVFLAIFASFLAICACDCRYSLSQAITDQGIQTVGDIIYDYTINHLARYDIPNISGKTEFGIGSLEYNITNISIAEMDLNLPELLLLEDEGIYGRVDGNVMLDAKFDFKELQFPYVSGSGQIRLRMLGLVGEVIGELGVDSNGYITITVKIAEVDLGNVSIDITSQDSEVTASILNTLSHIFLPILESVAEKSLNSVLVDSVNNALSKFMSDRSPFMAVGLNNEKIDMRVVENPEIGGHVINFRQRGLFVVEDVEEEGVTVVGEECSELPIIVNDDDVQVMFRPSLISSSLELASTNGELSDVYFGIVPESMLPESMLNIDDSMTYMASYGFKNTTFDAVVLAGGISVTMDANIDLHAVPTSSIEDMIEDMSNGISKDADLVARVFEHGSVVETFRSSSQFVALAGVECSDQGKIGFEFKYYKPNDLFVKSTSRSFDYSNMIKFLTKVKANPTSDLLPFFSFINYMNENIGQEILSDTIGGRFVEVPGLFERGCRTCGNTITQIPVKCVDTNGLYIPFGAFDGVYFEQETVRTGYYPDEYDQYIVVSGNIGGKYNP
ncbi:hypothetical protein ADUPG1_008026 [Aduncisulcus paluster]|uniref:Lipid-binding serum glycoprotein C-terminal domain-containing protein n=1 Tax=Aduncisulcus paluster TaxID=2918883 RepID=A0ABQ5KQK4_9EUKA|nr:hypothetical protein ADUPG1_008026 [Aduncisulcus paluster]